MQSTTAFVDTAARNGHCKADRIFDRTLHLVRIDLVFGFTGKLFDQAVGLQNNLNRWYDPTMGKWISQDPIGFDGGDANLYRYVGNKAAYRRDPSGLMDPEELREELLKRLEAEKQKAIAAGRIDEADRINRIMGREHTTGPGNPDKHTAGQSRKSKAALKKAAANLAAIEQSYDNCISTVKKQPIDWILADALEDARQVQRELLRQKNYEINHSIGTITRGSEKRLLEKLEIEETLKEIDEAEKLLREGREGAARGKISKLHYGGKLLGVLGPVFGIYDEIVEPAKETKREWKSGDRWYDAIPKWWDNYWEQCSESGWVMPGYYHHSDKQPNMT